MNRTLIHGWLKLPPGSWPPDPYTLLGLEPGESDPWKIEAQVQERMGRLRAHQLVHPEEVTEAMNRLAQALVSLTEAKARQVPQGALLPPPARARKGKTMAVVGAPACIEPSPPPTDLPFSEPFAGWDGDPVASSPPPHPPRRAVWVWLSGLVGLSGLTLAILWLPFPDPQEIAGLPPVSSPETLREVRGFTGFPGTVTSLAFDPDGGRLFFAAGDHTIHLWDLQAGEEVRAFAGHTGPVTCLALSPDGRRLLSGSDDATVRVWDVAGGEELNRWQGHTGPVTCLAVSRDGRLFLSGSEDQSVRLWGKGPRDRKRFLGHTGLVTGVAFSADESQVLSCGRDNTLRVWDGEEGQEVRRWQSPTREFTRAVFAPDGGRVLAADGEGLKLFDVRTGQPRLLGGRLGAVTAFALSPDGRAALAGCRDGTIHWLDVATGQERACSPGQQGAVTCLAFSPSGRQALSAGTDRTLYLWERPR